MLFAICMPYHIPIIFFLKEKLVQSIDLLQYKICSSKLFDQHFVQKVCNACTAGTGLKIFVFLFFSSGAQEESILLEPLWDWQQRMARFFVTASILAYSCNSIISLSLSSFCLDLNPSEFLKGINLLWSFNIDLCCVVLIKYSQKCTKMALCLLCSWVCLLVFFKGGKKNHGCYFPLT